MVEEEEFNSVFSALSHPLRRNILAYIVDHGAQGYSELLTHFSLETGTLNYHLERMTNFLEQDEVGKYKATNVGYAAYKLLGVAKTELTNPHAPPVLGLGISQSLRKFGQAVFDTLILPEQAFEDARNLSWPYLSIGVLVIAGYLLLHWVYSGCSITLRSFNPFILSVSSCEYFLSGIIAYLMLAGFFIVASSAIYRHRFSLSSALACYSIGFLPLIFVSLLNSRHSPLFFVTDPTYSSLRAFVLFLLLAWDAYLFLVAGSETFKLTMSQSFTATAVGFVFFVIIVQLIIGFRVFPALDVL